MTRIRRDLVLMQLRRGNVRLALTILFLPNGWSMTRDDGGTET